MSEHFFMNPPPETADLNPSHQETIATLRDIEAFFRKEAAYECENMGAGGSAIALGRWKRYYMALANVIQDLPELIAHDQELAALRRDAGRLDWLLAIGGYRYVVTQIGGYYVVEIRGGFPVSLAQGLSPTPRAAIDSAMAALSSTDDTAAASGKAGV